MIRKENRAEYSIMTKIRQKSKAIVFSSTCFGSPRKSLFSSACKYNIDQAVVTAAAARQDCLKRKHKGGNLGNILDTFVSLFSQQQSECSFNCQNLQHLSESPALSKLLLGSTNCLAVQARTSKSSLLCSGNASNCIYIYDRTTPFLPSRYTGLPVKILYHSYFQYSFPLVCKSPDFSHPMSNYVVL